MDTQKRLTLSETNKQLAGVCGGIGEYFGIDPTLVRLVFVVAAFMGGPGLAAYIILWAIIPKPEYSEEKPKRH